MNALYIFARKLPDGSVSISRPSSKPMIPAEHWLTIDRDHSHKPDYRHKWINLNCYRYAIMWDKR